MQIDAKNNQFIKLFTTDGDGFNPAVHSKSLVTISPDGKTSYFAAQDSFGDIKVYDVAKDVPLFKQIVDPFNYSSSATYDLHVTATGDYLYAIMGGNIARIRLSDMSLQGSFYTELTPFALTTSPDGKIAYTYVYGMRQGGKEVTAIRVWETETQKLLCEYRAPRSDDIKLREVKLAVDNTNTYLLVASANNLSIYNTGCPVVKSNH